MDDHTRWHSLSGEEVLEILDTDADQGLGLKKARKLQAKYGRNQLPTARQRTVSAMFLDQFRDLMIQILLVAAIIAAFIGEPRDAIVILVIVVLNALIGVIQQYRAENAMAALRDMSAPSAQVIRGGSHSKIAAKRLVPGDIVILETGAVVPADLRLIETVQLQVDESLLTGESVPVEKITEQLAAREIPLGDRTNMAYRSTLVTRGRAVGVVVATGTHTEIGGIANLLNDVDELDSPLQQRLNAFSKRLAWGILTICALIFISGISRGEPWLLMLLTAVSLAVAAIPEALPAVTSISLALGARRLAADKALVRNLPAVETLGSVSFICSDKTGTLTMNRMNAERVVTAAGSLDQLPHHDEDMPEVWQLTGRILAISNDVQFTAEQLPEGDPTEVALWEMADTARFLKAPLQREFPRVAELPFTSERKLMSTLHEEDGNILVLTKGAPEILIERCSLALGEDGPQPLDADDWSARAEELSDKGYRVLALAYRRLPSLPDSLEGVENELTLLGLAALIDPPREGVLAAVQECKTAGIHSVMITGDHPGTAREIARRLGIGGEDEHVVSGPELDALSDDELEQQVVENRVYARVSPAQKIRLVRALQAQGQFVAMTGDGVNDAPALRQADIGVAMGENGTDVAREAGAMILLDDNFATIVRAVREGRRIFDNIRKFVKYTMTDNTGEILTIALAPLLGLPLPLLPIHILWINLATDGLPGLALTAQPAEHDVMRRPPRPPQESLFSHGMWQHILLVGLLIGGLSLGVQAWAIDRGSPNWQTMVFTVLTFCQLAHVLAIHNERESIGSTGLLQNPALVGAVVITVMMQLAVIYLPLLNDLFHTTPLSAQELSICFALPMVVFVVVEIEKWLVRRGLIYGYGAVAKG